MPDDYRIVVQGIPAMVVKADEIRVTDNVCMLTADKKTIAVIPLDTLLRITKVSAETK